MTFVVGILVGLAAAIGASQPAVLPDAVPVDRASLQAEIDLAQHTIDDPSSSGAELASAGQFEQLATDALARQSRAAQRAILTGLTGTARWTGSGRRRPGTR